MWPCILHQGFLSAPCGICPQVRFWKWDGELQTFLRMLSHHMPLVPTVAHHSYTPVQDAGFTREPYSVIELKGLHRLAEWLTSQRFCQFFFDNFAFILILFFYSNILYINFSIKLCAIKMLRPYLKDCLSELGFKVASFYSVKTLLLKCICCEVNFLGYKYLQEHFSCQMSYSMLCCVAKLESLLVNIYITTSTSLNTPSVSS